MKLLMTLLSLLDFQTEAMPQGYGLFHFFFIFLAIGVTLFLCFKFKNCSDKAFRIIALICWLIMTTFEIYKQFVYSYSVEPTLIEWDYQWYAFPYQLCSTPLYVLPFIFLQRDSKFRDAFIAYMGTFSLFAGTAVFCYPGDVFSHVVGISIQTMVHHGLQIVLGVFFLVYSRKKINFLFFLKSIPVFASLVTVAMIANEAFMLLGIDETFNMFFISRHFDCTLPLLSLIYPKIHYVLFAALYIFGFTLIAFIVFLIAFGFSKIKKRKKNA
jgi:hypothetical protein